jgi:ABC-type uncharacterized transport system involved in gliding motility auxiliary subunit
MSRWAKILFFVSLLSLVIVLAVRYVLGGWIDGLYVPLVLSAVCFIAGAVLDIKFFLEFFTMRTTKHGMNMGTMILLVLAGLVAVNFLAVRKNKVFDITEDKLYSLSAQTVSLLKSLKEPIKVKIFYRGDKSKDALAAARETLRLYEDSSAEVDVEFFDTYVENIKAQDYLNSLPDKDSPNNRIFMFVESAGKRERVNAPFSESEVTSAMVKVTRKSSKVVYFLTGHGERDLTSEGEEGLKGLAAELERYAAKVEALNLLQKASIPEDATAIVIAGPKMPLMPAEIDLLKEYLAKGGKMLVMADPGEKHNLQDLLSPMGVEFSNTFVVNVGVQVQGASQVTAVGLDFDQSSEVTRPFVNGNTFALFHLASEVRKAPQAKPEVTVTEIVKTSPQTLTISELSNDAEKGDLRAYSLAVTSKGKIQTKDGKPAEKEFTAVVFGDSDIASNKLVSLPTNLNLLLNSIAMLTGETELISIRPKQPAGTKLVMTNAIWLGVVAGGVLIPLVLMVTGSVIWFRRRSA